MRLFNFLKAEENLLTDKTVLFPAGCAKYELIRGLAFWEKMIR